MQHRFLETSALLFDMVHLAWKECYKLRGMWMFYTRDLSIFSCTLSLIGVWSFLIFLVLPFLFFLIVAILVPDLCPHSTSPMYLVWHFINNIFTLSIKKKSCKNRKQIQENLWFSSIEIPLLNLGWVMLIPLTADKTVKYCIRVMKE